jgi:hypothetical protein
MGWQHPRMRPRGKAVSRSVQRRDGVIGYLTYIHPLKPRDLLLHASWRWSEGVLWKLRRPPVVYGALELSNSNEQGMRRTTRYSPHLNLPPYHPSTPSLTSLGRLEDYVMADFRFRQLF